MAHDVLRAVFAYQLADLKPAADETVYITVRGHAIGDLVAQLAPLHRCADARESTDPPDDALVLDNGPVKMLGPDRAQVDGGFARGRGFVRELLYDVERGPDGWTVTRAKLMRML